MNPLVPVEQDSAKIIDIGAVMNAVRRRIIPIAITMVIVLALTAVSYKLATPRYSAEGQVGIERTNEEIVNAQQDQRLQPLTTDSSSVDTEVTQILSPETLGRVVDRLGLAKNPDFVGTDPVDPTTARNNAIGALTGGLSQARRHLLRHRRQLPVDRSRHGGEDRQHGDGRISEPSANPEARRAE